MFKVKKKKEKLFLTLKKINKYNKNFLFKMFRSIRNIWFKNSFRVF